MAKQNISIIIKRIKDDDRHRRSGSMPRSLAATIYYIDNAQLHGDKILILDNKPVLGAINLLADENDRQAQRDEISANHRLYKGRGRTLDHFIISYGNHLNIKHTHKDFYKDVKALMEHMGMGDHACMYSAHQNTENTHLHVVIDRVSTTVNRFGNYYIPVDVGTVTLKNKQGLIRRVDAYCQHAAMYEICERRAFPIYGILYNAKGEKLLSPQYGKIAQASLQEELRTGLKSIQTRIQEFANKIFTQAKDWQDALTLLNEQNVDYKLCFEKSGNIKGAILTGPDGVRLKSSALKQEHSYKMLIQRFGKYPQDFVQNKQKLEHIFPKITFKKVKEILKPIFQDAVQNKIGWEKLENILTTHEQKFKLVPSGGSYVVLYNDEKDKIKLSKIDRSYSKSKLDEIFIIQDSPTAAIDIPESAPVPIPLKPTSKKPAQPSTPENNTISATATQPIIHRPTGLLLIERRRRAVQRALHHEKLVHDSNKLILQEVNDEPMEQEDVGPTP